ncbi:hypothetical protein BaRGS_00022418 [Batillaria attramentaria]|uniref:Uncharacterized protein n=1 Tax=Batillaria attramentaria TaxID=370345 RepID=A0ABD0KHB1_9CAEN
MFAPPQTEFWYQNNACPITVLPSTRTLLTITAVSRPTLSKLYWASVHQTLMAASPSLIPNQIFMMVRYCAAAGCRSQASNSENADLLIPTD